MFVLTTTHAFDWLDLLHANEMREALLHIAVQTWKSYKLEQVQCFGITSVVRK